MQTLISDQNFKPPFVKGYELTANSSDSSEFSQPVPSKPCRSSSKSVQHPAYEPGKYSTLPTQMIGANLWPSSREAARSKSDLCIVERSDKRVSRPSDRQSKSPVLLTGYDGRPVLFEEYQGESVWNPRASMAFDNAKGLLNPIGQNNCFLNSAVQVLWHLDVFRRNFRILSGHACVQNSCIFCALKVIFTQFQFSDHKVLPSDVLREALAEAFANEQRFQLGRMDDASECFETILQRIHFHLAWNQSEETCQVLHCIPHQKFAMLLVEQVVCACNASAEPLIFNQLVYHVPTSAIISYLRLTRLGASGEQNVSFGCLLYHAKNSGETRRCPSSCGGLIETRHTLANTPEVISVGFVWDSDHPSRSHVRKVVQCISTELRPSELVDFVVDEDWGRTTTLRLVGLVCYHGRHYSTFFFHSKMLTWILFDDARVREVGPAWETLMDLCVAGLYQPLLLLYADPNGRLIDVSAAPARNISLERGPCNILAETEHDGYPEETLNPKQTNSSRCPSRRDLLFGGDCPAAKTGSEVRTHLSPDCPHKAQWVKIPQEAPVGQMQNLETTSLTRDKSTLRFVDSTKRNNEDLLVLNQFSFNKSGDNFLQENVFKQQTLATKETAGNSSANVDDLENSRPLNHDQVVRSCTAVENGMHGSTVSKQAEPTTNRAKTVRFSHLGVGVSPGGTVDSFVISDVEQYPRFHEQFSKESDLLRSSDRVNSLQFVGDKLKNTNSAGIEHRSSGDEDHVCDGFLDTQNNFRNVETVCEPDHGSSQSTTLSTDEGKESGVYISEKTVRNVLSSQGVSCRRLTPRELAYNKSVQIGKNTAEVIGDHDVHSRNRKSIETKANTEPYMNSNRLPVNSAQTMRSFSCEEWVTGKGCLDEAEVKRNKCTDGQPLLCNRTSNTKLAINKPNATSKHPARTSKLLSNAEVFLADLTSVSKTAPTHTSTSVYPAVPPSASTEMSVSSVPHFTAASRRPCVSSIPSSNIDASQGYNTFPRRSRNIESQASNSASFARSLKSSNSSWSKNKNHPSKYNTYEQTTNEQSATDDNNRQACQWVEQRRDGSSSDVPSKCQSSLSPPLGVRVADWQPSGGSSSEDVEFNDFFSVSQGSKMQLFRDSLQLLKGCDEHVTLSKAELDMGNERLAAEHCSMASELLEDAFQSCQLDSDLMFLFRSSQNNVQKCQNNLKQYITHFSNDDEGNEEYNTQAGPKRDVERVFYLSAYIPSHQGEQVDVKGSSEDECKVSSLDICSQVSAAEDKERISNRQLRPTENITQDPTINIKIVNASQIKRNPNPNFSGVNNTNAVDPSFVSTNGKFTNALNNYRSSSSSNDYRSSSSLPKNRTNVSSLSTMSLPRNSTSVSSAVSLPRNSTSVSSSSVSLPRNSTSVSSMSLSRNSTSVSSAVSLPRNSTSVLSSSVSLPRNSTSVSSMSLPRNSTSVSSAVSLPRNSTSVSSSSVSLPRNSTSVSSMSLPRNSTSVSSMSLPRSSTSLSSTSLNGTRSLSLFAKGTSASLLPRNTALPVSVHKRLPKSRTSCQAGNTDNSEKTCRTRTSTLTDCEPKGYINSNDYGPCSGSRNILDPTGGRTHAESYSTMLSSVSIPSLVELTLESGDQTKPGVRGTGLSWPDSAAGEPSSLRLMSQRLQKLEKQSREIRDKLLKEKDVLWC